MANQPLLTNEQILKFIDTVNRRMKSEQVALSEDDPKSTCAAWHRGSIAAYGSLLKEFQKMLSENEHK